MIQSIWELKNISAGFSEQEGRIENINLNVQAGERVALLGEKTSGKYILFRVLSGLRPHRVGSFSVLGEDIKKLNFFDDWDKIFSFKLRHRMGICLERHGLLSNVSLKEGLETLYRFQKGGSSHKQREQAQLAVQEQCVRFGLESVMDLRPFALNSAELKLASLARAFLLKPELLLLENPSDGIGDLHVERLWSAIESIVKQQEVTIFISTDDWALASYFCPRWIVMDQGKIIYDGSPQNFLKSEHFLAFRFREHLKMRTIHEKALRGVA